MTAFIPPRGSGASASRFASRWAVRRKSKKGQQKRTEIITFQEIVLSAPVCACLLCAFAQTGSCHSRARRKLRRRQHGERASSPFKSHQRSVKKLREQLEASYRCTAPCSITTEEQPDNRLAEVREKTVCPPCNVWPLPSQMFCWVNNQMTTQQSPKTGNPNRARRR